jgi:hypothetical protein
MRCQPRPDSRPGVQRPWRRRNSLFPSATTAGSPENPGVAAICTGQIGTSGMPKRYDAPEQRRNPMTDERFPARLRATTPVFLVDDIASTMR